MSKRGIVLHLDEGWYDALSRQLKRKDTTIEDELNAYLDEMLNQLPAPVYARVSREIWEEDQRQRQAAEAARRFSVFRVTQGGRTDHLLTEGAGSMDALQAAMRLRSYLLRKGNSSERFIETIPAADCIAPEVFREYIHFTEDQKRQANNVDLAEFLRAKGEPLIQSGRELRMGRNHSVTVRGSEWYDHAAEKGGGPVSFLKEFYGMDYQQAVLALLDQDVSQLCFQVDQP